MTKEEQTTQAFELIEKIWGNGVLMAFADIVKESEMNNKKTLTIETNDEALFRELILCKGGITYSYGGDEYSTVSAESAIPKYGKIETYKPAYFVTLVAYTSADERESNEPELAVKGGDGIFSGVTEVKCIFNPHETSYVHHNPNTGVFTAANLSGDQTMLYTQEQLNQAIAKSKDDVSDESEYDKGMREAMQKIAVSCGKKFAVDIGYKDLPDLVDLLVRKKPVKKEVVQEYEQVTFEKLSDLVLHYENGGELYLQHAHNETKPKVEMYGAISAFRHGDQIYRKVTQEEQHQKEVEDLAKVMVQSVNLERWFWEIDECKDRLETKHKLAKLVESSAKAALDFTRKDG